VADEVTKEIEGQTLEPAELPEEEPEAAPPLKRLRLPYPPSGGHRTSDKEEPESGFQRNLREFGQSDPGLMATARYSMYVPGGTAVSAAAFTIAAGRSALRGFEQARREPIVERVNPNYPAPPCSPQDIVGIQNDVLHTLDSRVEAEAASTAMAGQDAEGHRRRDQRYRSAREGRRPP
jgi:hypothetical protein